MTSISLRWPCCCRPQSRPSNDRQIWLCSVWLTRFALLANTASYTSTAAQAVRGSDDICWLLCSISDVSPPRHCLYGPAGDTLTMQKAARWSNWRHCCRCDFSQKLHCLTTKLVNQLISMFLYVLIVFQHIIMVIIWLSFWHWCRTARRTHWYLD